METEGYPVTTQPESHSHKNKKVPTKSRDKSSDLAYSRRASAKSKNIGHFILGEKLGEGTFGVVRLGTHILTGEKVAVKILEKKRILGQDDKTRVEREIKILKCLRHSNIIQLYSVIQTVSTIYLIMEYASGKELFDYIVMKKKLSEAEACRFYQQIISGIDYLHKLRIVHRDLKPENLLLDHKKDLKVVDFGLSNTYNKGELLRTACGSPCYAAPEMIANKPYSGMMVDVWSSGIILYAMLCGFLPFEDADNTVLYKKITDGKFNIPSSLSDGARDLIKKVLNTDPTKRYNISQIKSHPWFNFINPSANSFDGLLINLHVIPIDEALVNKMEEYDFKREEVRTNLLSNRHNHITTTYYLLLKNKIRKGGTSVADLVSENFRNYISDECNLLVKFNNDFSNVIKERAISKKEILQTEDFRLEEDLLVTNSNKEKILEGHVNTIDNNKEGNLQNNYINSCDNIKNEEQFVNLEPASVIGEEENQIKNLDTNANLNMKMNMNNQTPLSVINNNFISPICINLDSKSQSSNSGDNNKKQLESTPVKEKLKIGINIKLNDKKPRIPSGSNYKNDKNDKYEKKIIKENTNSYQNNYLNTETVDKFHKEIHASPNLWSKIETKTIKQSPNSTKEVTKNLKNSQITKIVNTSIIGNSNVNYSSTSTPQSALSTYNKVNQRRKVRNIFNTSMSFENNGDVKETTFEQESTSLVEKTGLKEKKNLIDKKFTTEKNSKNFNNVQPNNSVYQAAMTEANDKKTKFDVIKEEEEFTKAKKLNISPFKGLSRPVINLSNYQKNAKIHSYTSRNVTYTEGNETSIALNLATESTTLSTKNEVRSTQFKKHTKTISVPNADILLNVIEERPIPYSAKPKDPKGLSIHLKSYTKSGKDVNNYSKIKAFSTNTNKNYVKTESNNEKLVTESNNPKGNNLVPGHFRRASHGSKNNYLAMNEDITSCKGPIDLGSVCFKPPKRIKEEINYYYRLVCDKSGMKFEVEISKISDCEGYVIKFRKMEGSQTSFRELCKVVLTALHTQ